MSELNAFDKATLTSMCNDQGKESVLKRIQHEIDDVANIMDILPLADRTGKNHLDYVKNKDLYDRLVLFRDFLTEEVPEPDLM